MAPPADPLIGEVLLGRYRVVSMLGEGTMGRVYLGEQRVGEDTRNVAIKVLAAARGNDDYIVARFRREASTIASLEHPNIIKLFDYGEEDGRFLSVMEYVPGGSLAALIAKGRLPLARVETLAWQIAGALDVAHRRGVVHRDLKPENVLVASLQDASGGADVVKVVDFGIARRPPSTPGERPLTMTGAMLGTPAFMAPEQFMGETADARADVYALALVIYQMLAGVLPWAGGTVMEWGEAHLQQAPRPLRTQPGCAELPERYDAAIARALAKDPRQRTATTLDFVREFTGATAPGGASQPHAASVVPGALPPSADEFAPPFKRSSGFTLAVLVVIAIIGAVGAFFGVRAMLSPSEEHNRLVREALDSSAARPPMAPLKEDAPPTAARDAGPAPTSGSDRVRPAQRGAASQRTTRRTHSPSPP